MVNIDNSALSAYRSMEHFSKFCIRIPITVKTLDDLKECSKEWKGESRIIPSTLRPSSAQQINNHDNYIRIKRCRHGNTGVFNPLVICEQVIQWHN